MNNNNNNNRDIKEGVKSQEMITNDICSTKQKDINTYKILIRRYQTPHWDVKMKNTIEIILL